MPPELENEATTFDVGVQEPYVKTHLAASQFCPLDTPHPPQSQVAEPVELPYADSCTTSKPLGHAALPLRMAQTFGAEARHFLPSRHVSVSDAAGQKRIDSRHAAVARDVPLGSQLVRRD